MPDEQEDDMTQASAYGSDDFFRMVKNRGTTPASQIISRAVIKTYLDTLYEPVGGGGTGWQTVTETWTRTGNYTFTVATDLTTKYQKGTKVRYKDGGAFEYGVIATSSYGSPNTTITLITNTDYAMAAGTITDTAISYQEHPQGWPGWFNWTITWGGFSTPPTGAVSRFTAKGTTITVNIRSASTGTSNATTMTASLPVVAKTVTSLAWSSPIQYFDNDVLGSSAGLAYILSAGTVITFQTNWSTGGWTASAGKSVPLMTIVYEM